MYVKLNLIFLFIMLILTNTANCTEIMNLSVKIEAETPPSQITLNKLDSIDITNFEKDKNNDYIYKLSVPKPWSDENEYSDNLLVKLYQIVVSWGDDKEQLYLGFKPLCPNKINLTIYHKPFIKCDHNTLFKIESLGTDFDSVLRKYFHARFFHKKWRYVNRQPLHVISIRSARLWFDASAALVKLSKSVFTMDEEIKKIMDEYENLAKQDSTFNKRYRKYARNAYIKGIEEQLFAIEYSFIGKIPALIKQGQLDKAKFLNTIALTAYSNESEIHQKIISSHQKIDLTLLQNNSKYIESLWKKQNNINF